MKTFARLEMPTINTYLDECTFLSVVDVASGKSVFGQLKELMKTLLASDVTVYSRDVFSFVTGFRQGARLYEWFYSESKLAGLDQWDVRDFIVLFQRLSDLDDIPSERPCLRWEEDDSQAKSEACWYAWLEPTHSELPGLICIGDQKFGKLLTLKEASKGVKRPVFGLGRASDALPFFRSVLRATSRPDEVFNSVCSIAFPTISFAEDLRPTALGVDLFTHMATVVTHLSFLADSYCLIGNNVGWDQFRIVRAAAAHGVDLSDESSNTKANARVMRQRNASVLVDGMMGVYTCSLHTKIEPTKGRIHFCVSRRDSHHHVIVGLFERHLDT